MKNNDTIPTRDELRQRIQQAVRDNDTEGFTSAFDLMQQRIVADLQEEFEQRVEELQQLADAQALAARGVRQLTSEEKKFYQQLMDATRSKDTKQALSNVGAVLPETVINSVFDDIRTNHPLLSRIDFIPSGAAVKMIMNTNGNQSAAWGELCDEIVKELAGGFQVVNATLFKLSAFLPVCKQALTLGPEWMDRYVRETLYEAFANGLEAGAVDGTGKDQPIGMTRQVGAGVVVTDGVYPRKDAIAVSSLDIATLGGLISLMATDPSGEPRPVRDLILVCNPVDYFATVAPAALIQGPDGSYRSALAYPVEIIQSMGVPQGYAVLGMSNRYAAFAGSSTEGNIDYSDHYHFLEDERVYLIKGFANGMPKDNNAFLYLDISGLKPLHYKVEVVDSRTPSSDATLASLKIGALTLSPAFDPTEDTYTASTTNATNVINAVPADAGARISITLNGALVANGSALTWSDADSGVNEVVITVVAEDGTTTEAYTVTVTKS